MSLTNSKEWFEFILNLDLLDDYFKTDLQQKGNGQKQNKLGNSENLNLNTSPYYNINPQHNSSFLFGQ